MKLNLLKPKKALNKAYLKIKPIRKEIEVFKKNLIELLDNSNDVESEEFHKNLVSDFLKNTYYEHDYFINTKGRNDLVIHNESKAKSPVGVILETKKPTNSSEMMTAGKPNTKALQELVLYYLRERIHENNLEVKKLIVTNIYEWFIFDASVFEQHFAQNKSLVKQFKDFENGSLSGTSTDFFYKEIAQPAIEAIQEEIECTYFDFRKYEKPLRNTDKKDDIKLVALFKLLSPQHLLKKPFTNDSNSLDKSFYAELLHIIGLSEQKQGGKKIIERNPVGKRNTGSLLEDAIIQIDSMDRLSRLNKPSQYGKTQEERLFHVGLELSITWINRILFLKLLEAQLIAYHEGDKSYAFLNFQRISSYDDLNSLFFQVLARKFEDRNADVSQLFEKVPYLNSSLFEPTEIEHNALFISNLRDDKTLPIHDRTVLKDAKGKRRTGELSTLEYLFDFLNAYDFSGEGSENIQEDNKTLINASVLGLIFEKINGYKDGSFFTPGFITMYMCRETIRKAVVQKFNEAALGNVKSSGKTESVRQQSEPTRPQVEGFPPLEGDKEGGRSTNKYANLTDIYNAIGSRGEFSHQQANELINDIKICDPAVGSGHFLVSALNEMIAVKHDLGVLHDRQGKLLRDYDVHIENDELIITDYNGELFEYHSNNRESQRVQETLFHEKQTLIENCLFGVDINANSVKICRLRLWIELLKNAYYISPADTPTKSSTKSPSDSSVDLPADSAAVGISPSRRGTKGEEIPQLQTLPNIDINIKCGNSLISRFDLDADLSKALRNSKWNMDGYRIAVQTYRNAENKEQKHEMERLIADIKGDFKTEISRNSKEQRLYDKASAKLYEKHTAPKLFEDTLTKKQNSQLKKDREKLEKKVTKLKQQLDEIKDNKIYENAFEWRFEFPEVLDDDGGFVGFDVVIGNPPYVVSKERYLVDNYKTGKCYDLYCYFFELGHKILNSNSFLTFITPSLFIKGLKFKSLHDFLLNETSNLIIEDKGDNVFDEVSMPTAVTSFKKKRNNHNYDWYDLFVRDPISIKVRTESEFIGNVSNIQRGLEIGKNKTTDILSNYQIITGTDIERYFVKKIRYIDEQVYDKYIKSNLDFYTKERVLIRETGSELTCVYLNKFLLSTRSLYSIIPNDEIDSKYLISILCSKLIQYFYQSEFRADTEVFPKIRISQVKKIPIKVISTVQQKPFINLVDQILTAKQADSSADTTALEREIDVLIYRLYGLSYEEVKVVDEGFWMSVEEYDNLKINN